MKVIYQTIPVQRGMIRDTAKVYQVRRDLFVVKFYALGFYEQVCEGTYETNDRDDAIGTANIVTRH